MQDLNSKTVCNTTKPAWHHSGWCPLSSIAPQQVYCSCLTTQYKFLPLTYDLWGINKYRSIICIYVHPMPPRVRILAGLHGQDRWNRISCIHLMDGQNKLHNPRIWSQRKLRRRRSLSLQKSKKNGAWIFGIVSARLYKWIQVRVMFKHLHE